MKRRGLLGAGAAALTVGFGACSAWPVIPKRPQASADDALGWVRHRPDNADRPFLLMLPCAEMGQHIGQALRTVAATELGVAPARVALRLPSSTDIGRVRATVGSDSVKDFALPLAQACATLREALASGLPVAGAGGLTLRAKPWPLAQLRSLGARPGSAWPAPSAAGSASSASSPSSPSSSAAAAALTEPFLHHIVTGAPLYAADMRLPGMVYGRVLRAPVSPELSSAPSAWDEAAARAVPGFVALVQDQRLRHAGSLGLGIVALTPGALDRVAQALAPRWQVQGGFEPGAVDAALDIDQHLARGALRHHLRRDRMDEAAPWTVDLRLDLPFAAHASIEPRAALAAFTADGPDNSERLRLWTGSQDLFYVRDLLARSLSLRDAQVQVQACRLGGGFGARTLVLVELEAALLARATGLPVKVMWTRAQELGQGFHRPPSSHRVRARVQAGCITHWWHAFVSSHILFTPAAMPAWMQRAADLVGDQGVVRGAALPYAVPQQRIEFDALRLPVHSGPWRGLGAGPNGLAVETAIDACAHAIGADALKFRLDHTDDRRLQAVLEAVAQDAGWRQAPRGPKDSGTLHGRGLACGIYKGGSRVAVVAEVEVDRLSGQPRVSGLWCAHDCGRVLVPDGVRAQVEGCLVWSLGMVLVERLPLGRSGVAAVGFAQSPIPRMDQVPPLRVRLLDSGAPPSGAGESTMTAAAAAIANALFHATGVRCARFPVQATDLQAAA